MAIPFICVECGERSYKELELYEGLDREGDFYMVVLCDDCFCLWVMREDLRLVN